MFSGEAESVFPADLFPENSHFFVWLKQMDITSDYNILLGSQ